MGRDNLILERAGFEYFGLVGSGFYHSGFTTYSEDVAYRYHEC